MTKFVVYYNREPGGECFVTTKKSEPAMLERYCGMDLHDRRKWERKVVKSHSVTFADGDGFGDYLEAE